ncbi:PLP-dependent aminotransferase family protein [Cohnella panacarvi]|uniref:MocR-like pyridoxine biosynthesis transcription factor PdxR n=1 Tax=Cohnella panacarvi TaxID=400776 RepID=UPI00047B6DDC|nr:PLP-dependent aminotransferase family protein [Cohnella panacarvi]
MELTLAFHGDEPLYAQVYKHIRTLIQEGAIADGAKLPSVRSLKLQLNISKTTVEIAYQMLLEEGYVYSKNRSGLIVVNPLAAKPQRQRKEMADRIADRAPSPGGTFIDFSLLTIDGDSFPLRQWKSVMGEALSIHAGSVHEYGDVRGEYELRESVAQYLRNSRGVACDPSRIIIGTGISYSLQLLSRLLGDYVNVGIEEHGIAQVRSYFTDHRFHIVPYSLEEEGLRGDAFRILYATPSHRPSGDPMPYLQRQRLLQWAYANQGYIIEDDYDGELRLSGNPIPSLQGMDKHGVVIYIGTFSKMFTPSLRMNYMVLPPELLAKLQSLEHTLSAPSRMDQWAMRLFISRGHWFRHIRRMRRIYRLKLETLTRLVRSHMPDTVRIGSSGSGLHIELSVKVEANADALIALAREEGVLVYGSPDPHIRSMGGNAKIYLGFGGVNESQMSQGVQALSRAWSAIR